MNYLIVESLTILYLLYVATIIHELGHFLAAYFLKRPLARVEVGTGPELGSFVWKGINFCFKLWPMSGFVKPVFISRRKEINIAIYAAGPGANILTFGILAFFGEAYSVLGLISIWLVVLNLFPWTSKKQDSDGQLILKEWKKKRAPLEVL